MVKKWWSISLAVMNHWTNNILGDFKFVLSENFYLMTVSENGMRKL
jgi:hypothetical protein